MSDFGHSHSIKYGEFGVSSMWKETKVVVVFTNVYINESFLRTNMWTVCWILKLSVCDPLLETVSIVKKQMEQ